MKYAAHFQNISKEVNTSCSASVGVVTSYLVMEIPWFPPLTFRSFLSIKFRYLIEVLHYNLH